MLKICKLNYFLFLKHSSFRSKFLPVLNPAIGSGASVISIITLYLQDNLSNFYQMNLEKQIQLCKFEFLIPRKCEELIKLQMEESTEYYSNHQNDWIENSLIGMLGCLFYYVLYIIVEKAKSLNNYKKQNQRNSIKRGKEDLSLCLVDAQENNNEDIESQRSSAQFDEDVLGSRGKVRNGGSCF